MHTPAEAAIGAATALTLGYWLWIKARPFKPCRACGGYGRLRRRLGPLKTCRKCKGTGLRSRASRKAARTARRAWTDSK